jgi:hypothetical protein
VTEDINQVGRERESRGAAIIPKVHLAGITIDEKEKASEARRDDVGRIEILEIRLDE